MIIMREDVRLVAWTMLLCIGCCAFATTSGSAADCSRPDAQVTGAFRWEPNVDFQASEQRQAVRSKDETPTISLGDTLVLEVQHLSELSQYEKCAKPLVLTMDDRPLTKLIAKPILDPSKNVIRFDLTLNADNRSDWIYQLGRPGFTGRKVRVSLAPIGEAALPSTASIELVPIKPSVLLIWGIAFAAMLGLFVYLAHRSNILRAQATELAPELVGRPQYSLSRVQAAWWFFVVMAAFVLIGIVTGDFENCLNGTALGLLGIGAGTIVGSATVDKASDTSASDPVQAAKLAQAQVDAQRAAILSKANVGDREKARLGAIAAKSEDDSKKLLGLSRGFLLDIVSDADGVAFHRFQMVAWTVALTIVFVTDVYRDLAMPTFSDVLFGLQGLSVVTYLGLKIPESKPLTG